MRTIADQGSPFTMALSPDGDRLAMINLPGRGFAEASVLDVRSGRMRRAISLPAPNIIDTSSGHCVRRNLPPL